MAFNDEDFHNHPSKKTSPGDDEEDSFTQKPFISDNFKSLQAEFRQKGWNTTSVNLLSFSCWIAKQRCIYVRSRLRLPDFLVSLFFSAVVGSFVGILTVSCSWNKSERTTTWCAFVVGLFVGSLTGIGYLLRRASHWQPMEMVIQNQLTSSQLSELVRVLVGVCADASLNPEHACSLVAAENVEMENDSSSKLLMTILEFFKTSLKMQQ